MRAPGARRHPHQPPTVLAADMSGLLWSGGRFEDTDEAKRVWPGGCMLRALLASRRACPLSHVHCVARVVGGVPDR